jgi:hypothetical protein
MHHNTVDLQLDPRTGFVQFENPIDALQDRLKPFAPRHNLELGWI